MRRWVILLGLGLALPVPASGRPVGGFAPVQAVGSYRNAAQPVVAVGPDSSVWALLTLAARTPAAVAIARRDAGGGWVTDGTLTVKRATLVGDALGVSRLGDVVVAAHTVTAHAQQRTVTVAFRSHISGRWSSWWYPAQGTTAWNDPDPFMAARVAFDTQGTAYVVWGAHGRVWLITHRAAGTAWSAPVVVGASVGAISISTGAVVAVVFDAGGDVATGTTTGIRVAANGSLRPVERLTLPPGMLVDRYAVAIDTAGALLVVARPRQPGPVLASLRSSSGGWSGFAAVPGLTNAITTIGDVTSTGPGHFLVVWPGASVGSTIIAAELDPPGWRTPITTTVAGGIAVGTLRVAADAAGDAVATWLAPRTNGCPCRLAGTLRPAGTTRFVRAAFVAARPGSAIFAASMAADAAGDFFTVAQVRPLSGALSSVSTVISTGWDAAAPRIGAVTVSGTSGNGSILSVQTRDTLSGIRRAPRWLFADATSARGFRVRHHFAHPGSYRVRIVVIDRVGNIASAVRAITVR